MHIVMLLLWDFLQNLFLEHGPNVYIQLKILCIVLLNKTLLTFFLLWIVISSYIMFNNTLNALVIHWNIHDHKFDLEKAVLIMIKNNWLGRRCVESVIIYKFITINIWLGSFTLLPILTKLLLKQCGRQRPHNKWKHK